MPSKKVKSKLVLLNFQRTWAKYAKTGANWVKNGSQTITGNVLLRLSENLIDHYKIEVYTGAAPQPQVPKLVEVTPTQVTRHLTIAGTGTSGTKVYDRRGYKRTSSSRKGRKKTKPIRIPLGDKKTVKGNERYVTIPFPVWFSGAMIMQALGTMLANAAADRKPLNFVTAAGGRVLIPYNVTAGAPPTGWDDGAWISQSLVVGTNIDDPNDPFYSDTTEVSGSSGDHDGANVAAPAPAP